MVLRVTRGPFVVVVVIVVVIVFIRGLDYDNDNDNDSKHITWRPHPLEETRAYREIFAKGEVEGEAKGEARAASRSLARLLHRRFGPLPQWASERVAAASVEQLDAWIERVLDVASLDVLIGPAPPLPDA